MINFKWEGIATILEGMRALESKVKYKLVRKAVTAGAKVFLEAMKSLTHRQSGLLAKSEGIKSVSYASGVAVAIIGPRGGFGREVTLKKRIRIGGKKKTVRYKQYRDPVFYAHLANRKHRFVEQAHTAANDAATSVAIEALAQGVNEAM